MVFAFPNFRDALKATKKLVERLVRPSRYMGRHGQQTAPVSLLEASGAMNTDTTDNGIVPGLFSGYSQRFNPRVDEGQENNGINSGCEANMDKLRIINGLDQMPDAQIVERKVYDGQRVAHFYAYGDLARKIIATGGQEDSLVLVVRLLPMDDVDTIETILEAEGYSVSRA